MEACVLNNLLYYAEEDESPRKTTWLSFVKPRKESMKELV